MALTPNTQTGTLSGKDHGTNDDLTGTGGPLYGDAFTMIDEARGGNDVLTGGVGLINGLIGDAQDMFDHTRGGNDVLIGGAGSTTDNTMLGDAANMSGHARGGNDLIIGGADAIRNIVNADGFSMTDYPPVQIHSVAIGQMGSAAGRAPAGTAPRAAGSAGGERECAPHTHRRAGLLRRNCGNPCKSPWLVRAPPCDRRSQ